MKQKPRKKPLVSEQVIRYLDRNYQLVVLEKGTKKGGLGWASNNITHQNVADHFSSSSNVALVLGKPSGGLVDIDLDCKEAIDCAPFFLPRTSMVFGRKSKRRSHYFYLSEIADSSNTATLQFKSPNGSVLCELRIGAQGHAAYTMVPPSVHPSGEMVEFDDDGEPRSVDGATLLQSVKRTAAAALIAQNWPEQGSRHEAAMVLDGLLARANWDIADRKQFVEAVCKAASDDEIQDRILTAKRTEQRLAENKRISGYPKFSQLFSKAVAQKVADWIDYPGRDKEEALERFNSKYAVIIDGGKTRILKFEGTHEKRGDQIIHTRKVPTFLQFQDFHHFHLGEKLETVDGNGRVRKIAITRWWVEHPDRARYEGLIFKPNGEAVINGRLNVWQGWGSPPVEGDWSLMRRHIAEILAAGDEVAETYILNWIAWLFQNPAERAEVALVFKGGRGVGKGTLGNALTKIFGQHATHISSIEHIAGRFNAHLRDVCFLFADEAYWPGARADEGTLKRLITEPTLFIEAKGRDGVTADNMLHVMMASNSDWVVPAGEHERRYAVFEVSESRRQDENWFSPLYAQMETGGYGAMLHDLLKRDLGDWHPRRLPDTQALRDQQTRSLEPLDAWLIDFLESGTLPSWKGSSKNPATALSRSSGDEYTPNPRNGLFDVARERVPALRHFNDQILASYLKRFGCKAWRNNQVRGWEFPPLTECRARWEEKYARWEWEHPEIAEWQQEQPDDNRFTPVF